MKTRKELLKSKGYWITKIQIDLFAQIKNYLEKNDLSKTAFAKEIGVTKGYVTQVLNGDFDHKVSKLVELSLAVNKVPVITYQDVNLFAEENDKVEFDKIERSPVNIYLNISKDNSRISEDDISKILHEEKEYHIESTQMFSITTIN